MLEACSGLSLMHLAPWDRDGPIRATLSLDGTEVANLTACAPVRHVACAVAIVRLLDMQQMRLCTPATCHMSSNAHQQDGSKACTMHLQPRACSDLLESL